jgi:thiol-disulfide isomerase/thioredoxin
MIQAVESLTKRSEDDAALQLAKKIEEGFRENPEPQIALSAWEMHASRLKETNEVGALMQADSKEDQDPVKARALVDALMAKIPSPWTAFFLVQIAIKVEYSGRPLIAKEMIEVAQTQVENLKDPDAKEELERNCKQFLSRFAVLNKPLNLSELVDTTGKPLDPNQYKGKVVLVDFWATWCGPCLQEIPNIENAFLAHNKNGFEVISVNLDEERSALDKFLASKKVLWNTYVSSKPDAIGFDTPLARDIGISAIPFIAIIGKDGNVAGIHIRGRKIEDKIVELLAKE